MENLRRFLLRRTGGRKRGFTLIELLIVLSILAVLAAVVVLALTGFIGRGEKQACESDENAIQTAVYSFYYESDGTWPIVGGDDNDINWDADDGNGNTLVPNYLNEVPNSDGKCDWELTADGQVCKGLDDADCDGGSCNCPEGCGTLCPDL